MSQRSLLRGVWIHLGCPARTLGARAGNRASPPGLPVLCRPTQRRRSWRAGQTPHTQSTLPRQVRCPPGLAPVTLKKVTLGFPVPPQSSLSDAASPWQGHLSAGTRLPGPRPCGAAVTHGPRGAGRALGPRALSTTSERLIYFSRREALRCLISGGSFFLLSKEIDFEEDSSPPGGLYQKNSVAYKVVCYFTVISYTMEG